MGAVKLIVLLGHTVRRPTHCASMTRSMRRQEREILNPRALLFGLGLSLMLVEQTLHAQQSDAADRNRLVELRANAERGDAKVQNELGLRCAKGQGVATNAAEAVKWFRLVAEQNYAAAQFNLGVSYATGQGVTKDVAEAVKWFRLAAEQNLDKAQFNLGLCYEEGQGVTKDEAEAMK
jgi:TPR repeat protein